MSLMFGMLSVTYCTCYSSFSLHSITPLFIITASHPSVAEGPKYCTKKRSDHKKHRGAQLSGALKSLEGFMVFLCHRQEEFRGEIQI